ncbi:cysteine desulfurase-like protein [Cereibacter changlensis JA139]|uniref:Cysteine desulfurase-like protein n=2 Tax=Cereibacter changlensis TaxID=402884 RepID=A0A2T4JPD8_9RHOB|nr:cysteine desulfurase-like protein [Cereibacter changlensis]PTE19755.1 cysteine desulfurase-like protein [Cereibacter changlensis JA139]PZX56183.1 cysteine desulfurase family protein (TIGR01976 family) [Cereibacter changlensis]
MTLDLTHVRSQFPGLSRGWTLFDNAGGSQILKGAVERMTEFLYQKNVQIGGSYEVSLAAAEALREARVAAATIMNAARPEEIVFGPSTTVLIQNLARAMRSQFSEGDEVIVTVADHESNIGPWMSLREFGVTVKIWPINRETLMLDLADLEPLMTDRTRLVAVTHVSNILGQVNPVADIARFVHERGALICVDAVAYAPHRAIDVQAWDVDYYVFSLYKTYGPHYAVMYGKFENLLELDTLYHYFYGKDKTPGKLEPGNPSYECAYSTLAIRDYLAGLGGASGEARARLETGFAAITAQEDALVARLLSYLTSRNDCRVFGATRNEGSRRIPTVAFRFDGHDSGALAKAMDAHKIAIRHGDFHSRRLVEDLGETGAGGLLRVSMVHYNTLEEVDRLCAAFDQILRKAA